MAGINITGNAPGALGGPSGSGQFPAIFLPPLIEISPGFPWVWQARPDLTLVRCTACASSVEAGSLELTRRYGSSVKNPSDATLGYYPPLELAGQWARFSVMTSQGPLRQFVGVIDNEPRTLTGTGAAAAGTQNFIAPGPLKILEKLSISQSVFYDPVAMAFNTVGWMPAMNRRDSRGVLVGNRNDDATPNDAGAGGNANNFCYGGKSLWSHLDYVYYLLTNYVQQPDGPAWTLMGQTGILDGMQTTQQFGDVENAAEILKKLINPKYGVDWCVVPTPAGFAINIFALSDQPITFAGVTMDANAPTLTINRDEQISLVEAHNVLTNERRVDQIVAIGKRITVCGTLWGEGLSSGDLPPDATPSADPVMPQGQNITLPATLVKRWSAALETEYIAASGATDADPDSVRRREKYRDVYQHLGAPANWDLDSGTWSVACKDDGTLTQAQFQTVVRETLGWIPLQQGFSYDHITTTTDKASGDVSLTSGTDNTDGTVEPETSPPLAWIYDITPTKSASQRYIQCEQNGIGVGRPHLDWGVFLHASPNHKLAYGHWSTEQQNTSLEIPEFDYDSVVATVAIESDHRLALVYNVPPAQAAGDGSIEILHDDGAELWVILPGTIVDCDAKGNLVAFGSASAGGAPQSPTILRNDVPRLALTMCGAIARYGYERARAQYAVKGFVPGNGILGRMLIVTQPFDQIQRIACVVTSIEWELGESPRTIIKTGYA